MVRALVGGEALPQDLADDLVANAASVRNVYGPTEATVWATSSVITTGDRVTIGQPGPMCTCESSTTTCVRFRKALRASCIWAVRRWSADT